MMRTQTTQKAQLQKHELHLKVNQHQLPGWILSWFYATAIVCTIDATFIVLRPLTLPGGSLFYFFYFYKWYIPVDQRYGDVGDSYVFTQSIMNYVEVILNVVVVYFHYTRSPQTKPLAYTVCVMTFWKTVLYVAMFYELAGGKDYRQGNTYIQEFFLVLVPNGIWLVLPWMCMVTLWDNALPKSGIESRKYA